MERGYELALLIISQMVSDLVHRPLMGVYLPFLVLNLIHGLQEQQGPCLGGLENFRHLTLLLLLSDFLSILCLRFGICFLCGRLLGWL